MRRFWPLALLLLFGCGKPSPSAAIVVPPATNPAGVKLVVLLVFDQLRGDYPTRWRDQYGEGGFKRLMAEGTWFSNCHYPYACTITGAGHASLLTGCSPDRHGIVGNEWFDRSTHKAINCATEDRYELVFSVLKPPHDPKEKNRDKGCTPARLLAPGFADSLKAGTGGKAKVVAMSIKDRSACLPAGNAPDAVYYFDSRTGSFVTSTYYRDRCHDWVRDFNARHLADQWLGKTWERLRPDLDYTKLSGPDDLAIETQGVSKKQGRVFPHPFSIGKPKPDKEFYDEVTCSPFGNELMLEFAKAACEGMDLGTDVVPDLLSISCSSNDIVGHQWGPDSHEVLDMTLRTDLFIKQLLDYLDNRVGKGNYLLALSSDHGICPAPEISKAKGLDAERINPDPIRKAAETFLDSKYGVIKGEKGKWIDADHFPWIYLNNRRIAGRGLNPAVVAEALAGWYKSQRLFAATYTRAQLEGPASAGDPYLQSMKKAYHPQRCGDLALVWKPYYTGQSSTSGATHSSPHPYDTHVPLMFFGPGMAGGACDEAVTPQAIAAVFSRAVGVTPPAMMEAGVPGRLR